MTSPEIPEGTVTVLFTDLVDSTRLNQRLGDESARRIGRQIEELARAAVTAHRGVIIKEMGDGLMAAFASARRAVASARDMQQGLGRLHRGGLDRSVQMRIGLHTGEVIGEDGDLHGETVIIAKRIEGLAPPGGILASETVRGVLGTARDELVDQGVSELKGIAAPWRLYLVTVPEAEVDPRMPGDHEPTAYVGRVAEREQLRRMLEQAAQGRGGMVLIGGVAGLGKSRLAREAAALAARMGMSVYTGNCLDMESPPPYQPAIDHLEQAARSASVAGFRAALGPNAPEVAKLVPSLRHRYDDIPLPPELTPEQERRYLLAGLGEFIERAAASTPLVLVYEDLHWADESTLLLLRHLGTRLASLPLLVIGTYRDDELDRTRPLTRAIGPLFRDVGAVDLRPRLLSHDEVRAVLAARAGSEVPPELVDLVFAETHGNPFFTEELFRHLRDCGRLFDELGGWRSGFEIGESEVPQGVRRVLERRLDRLDPEHRRMLSAAAVIGRTFSFATLAAVAGVGDDDLFDALEAAERLQVIEELPADHPADYLFVQEQVRQTLVGELSLARRQRVHLRIADALAGPGSASPVEIAHHVVSAGSAAPVDRRVDALAAAARATMGALAFEAALRHLGDALALVVDDDRRFELRREQARAMRGAGRVEDALRVLDDELTRTGDADRRFALRLERVQLLNDQYRAAEGLEDLEHLMAALDGSGDPRREIAVQLARGRAHYILSLDRAGEAEVSRDAYASAYRAAGAIGDRASMARALLPTTWFTDYWSDYADTARANVEEALALAEALGDEDLILDALLARHHRVGLGLDSLSAGESLLRRLEQRRDPVKLNAHCFWMMWLYFGSGRFGEAVAMCDRGMGLAALIGSDPVQYGSIKAMALAEAGRFDEVEAAIAEEVTDDDHPFGRAMAGLARSVFLVAVGAWGPAVEQLADTAERAHSLHRVWMLRMAERLMAVAAAEARAIGGSGVTARSEAGPGVADEDDLTAARVALAEGDPARAEQLAMACRPGGAARVSPVDEVRGLLVLAHARLLQGDHTGALEAAEQGVARAEPMGFGAALWQLLRVRGLAAQALGRPSAAVELAAADACFDALAARIADPGLRSSFGRHRLAPS